MSFNSKCHFMSIKIIFLTLILFIVVHNAFDLDNEWSHLYDKQLQKLHVYSPDFEETVDEINTAIKIAPLRYW